MYRKGNKLGTGSTQSGKSYAEVHDILAAAALRNVAIVVVDPHASSLARNSLTHLIARGHTSRIVWDQMDELVQVPKYRFLSQSTHHSPLVRAKENHQTAEQFSELLCRRRDQHSLAASPLTEEWTMKSILLLLNQPHDYLASDLRFALKAAHPTFQRLVRGCNHDDVRYEFEQIACGAIKSGQYSAAQRLINAVCEAPAFMARCGRAFDIGTFLDSCGILLIEGGPVSQPVMQTVLGSIILQTIHYVRIRPRPIPRILLVLDEATNANLVGAAGHEVRALAECQKMGLDIHILVQSLNFPSSYITDGVLTNCTRHEWHYAANAAVARKAADDLGDSDLEGVIRRLKVGERYVKERDRVFFERVPQLKNPWVFPQLANRKTARALEQIRQRPEYGGSDECPPGATVTPPSSNSPPGTSAARDTFSDTSPARRRRTGDSKNSGGKDPLRLVGSIMIGDTGRPELVYCNGYKPKQDQLRHELLLTDFLLCYPESDSLRGWAVNRRLRPDAEMTLNNYFYYVELDTGEQSHAQVRRRQARYAGVTDYVLYVTLSAKRLDGLRRHAHDAVKSIALFTTLAEADREPHGTIWTDCLGERTSI